jgi:hypothetical protein
MLAKCGVPRALVWSQLLEDAPAAETDDNSSIVAPDIDAAAVDNTDVMMLLVVPVPTVDPLGTTTAVTDFFKPVLSEDELRRQDAAELNDILNRAEAAAEAAAAAIAVLRRAPPIVIDLWSRWSSSIVEPVASSVLHTSPVRAESAALPDTPSHAASPNRRRPNRRLCSESPPPESPAPTDSPSRSNSAYRYAYVSSQLMGSSPSTRPRTNTSPEAPAVTCGAPRARHNDDGPIVVREADHRHAR